MKKKNKEIKTVNFLQNFFKYFGLGIGIILIVISMVLGIICITKISSNLPLKSADINSAFGFGICGFFYLIMAIIYENYENN